MLLFSGYMTCLMDGEKESCICTCTVAPLVLWLKIIVQDIMNWFHTNILHSKNWTVRIEG
jgi:hypothetical protein